MVNPKQQALAPGLYLVATPIGTARDITLRTLDILASADVIAAEDTRSLRKLMDIHGIALADRPLVAYHDHNGERGRPRLLRAIEEGKSVVYASEAGTPVVADPGPQHVQYPGALVVGLAGRYLGHVLKILVNDTILGILCGKLDGAVAGFHQIAREFLMTLCMLEVQIGEVGGKPLAEPDIVP